MKVTEQDLRERYEALETEQLLELQAQGTLTETAARVLEQVLAERSVWLILIILFIAVMFSVAAPALGVLGMLWHWPICCSLTVYPGGKAWASGRCRLR